MSAVFSTRRMSVVRRSYCRRDEDALYNGETQEFYQDFGIAAFTVSHLRVESAMWRHPTENIEYRLEVEHDPLPLLYPHCEVVVLQNGTPVESIRPKSVKLKIRLHLAKCCQKLKQPNQNT